MTSTRPRSRTARPRVFSEDAGQPLSRVGIIAILGFAVGVAWPRLAGVSLVPEAPVEDVAPPADDAPGTDDASGVEEPTKEIKPTDQLDIGKPQITSCRDATGSKHSSCGELDTDSLVHPVLRSLSSCPAASGAFGTLSLGMDFDFEKKEIRDIQSGKSTDLPQSVTKEILRCAKEGLASVEADGIPAEFAQYTVYYLLEFKTPEQVIQDEGEVTPASGKATVRWRTALIREEGNREAKVMERLLSGAEVIVTGRKGDWYRVKFDARGREGWVHGAALGLVKD